MFDGPPHTPTRAHETALTCLEAGIEAALPERAVERHCSLDGETLTVAGERYDLSRFDSILVLGGGKAAGGLASALETLLGDRLTGGAVVTDAAVDLARVACHVGEHPVPGEGSVAGTRRVLDLARTADADTLVLAPITGGGSALLAAPAAGVSLADLQSVTRALLEVGASIDEVNAVRKHCSAVKGGRLARACGDATVLGLLVSDVIGDDPGVVASGPTAPDSTTFADAHAVLERYGVDPPGGISERLEEGAAGEKGTTDTDAGAVIEETPGPDDPAFDRVRNVVLANAHTALEAAREVADERDYATCLLAAGVRGESREAALTHVAVAEEIAATGNPVAPPAVVLSGGETTVTVRGDGTGGPNQEFCLRAAIDLDDEVLACVDTDGRDGSTDAAGALVDGETVEDADDARSAREALARNDAFGYLDDRDALLRTGRTGTNVNDLRVLVVEGVGDDAK